MAIDRFVGGCRGIWVGGQLEIILVFLGIFILVDIYPRRKRIYIALEHFNAIFKKFLISKLPSFERY